MKIRIMENLCQGHGLCKATAPEIFTLREFDGHAQVELAEIPEHLLAKARMAQQSCPEYAIRLVEDRTSTEDR